MKLFITLCFVAATLFINGCGLHYLMLSYEQDDQKFSANISLAPVDSGLVNR